MPGSCCLLRGTLGPAKSCIAHPQPFSDPALPPPSPPPLLRPAAACKAPAASPSKAVKDLAQSLCDDAPADANAAFAQAVWGGGAGAADAVAALIYARRQLGCLDSSAAFDVVAVPDARESPLAGSPRACPWLVPHCIIPHRTAASSRTA